jgi:hypothetical protein
MRFTIAFTLLWSLLSGLGMMAQNTPSEADEYIYGANADSLLMLHVAYNQSFPEFPGYRIQLLMESGNHALTEAEELTVDFNEKYPEVGTYITFREPYYRVRVGDFRTRLEAENFLSKITRKYPSAWVIQDDIKIASLLPKPKTNDYE